MVHTPPYQDKWPDSLLQRSRISQANVPYGGHYLKGPAKRTFMVFSRMAAGVGSRHLSLAGIPKIKSPDLLVDQGPRAKQEFGME